MSPSAALEPLTLDALIDYVAQEQTAARAEYDELMALPVDDRVRRGYTLTGLRVGAAGREPGQVWLEMGEQLSRSLRGDEVLLIPEDTSPALLAGMATNGTKVTAQVLEVHSGKLLVQPARALDAGRTWRMEPAFTNHAAVVAKALTRIDTYHGQHLLDALNGMPSGGEDEGVSDPVGLLADLEAESGEVLDDNQRAAFCAAVRAPALWGLQGPPGTGKTRVAAFVAEGLARRLLHRVVVVSQSHEAVNRLLNEIAGLFPQRKLVKVGAALRPTPDAAIQRLTPQAYKREEKRLLRSRPILGMTLHTALLMADIHGFRADVVIVDEASQVPLAYGAALGQLGFSVLLFGDPAQLNAIVPAVLEENPLACSVLQRCAFIKGLVFLPITYRLNGALAGLVGSLFYPDAEGRSRILSGPGVGERQLRFSAGDEDTWADAVLDPQIPTVWVQTEEEGRRQSSRVEARLVTRLVKWLLAAGIKGYDIAVVTPFRQQVQLLGTELAGLPQKVRVGTVETMQGQSVEVVIVSLASSDPAYLSTIADFYFWPNRWNVAFSRARTKLVVVGSSMIVQAFPPAMRIGTSRNLLTTGLVRVETIAAP
ncbi:MAG: AAA domain-containing protein [Caldilineaceae bacterium]